MAGRPLPIVALIGLCVLALVVPAAEGEAGPDARSPYRGLGTWVDVYSPSFRADADELSATLARRGVRTLFVETGNFRQRSDLARPAQLERLIEAMHARGIAVVAWYLPGLTSPARDLRRARAATDFRTTAGDRFDSFALDIEATLVRDSAERTRRLLRLSDELRTAVGPDYPLGAIIPSPIGMKLLPRYWPRFPYAQLARIYDVLLPMAYFSYRAHGRAAVTRYVQGSIRIIRRAARPDVPIHAIGGLANVAPVRDAAAFARAAAACGVEGLSLYDFHGTASPAWPTLARATAARGTRCR